MADSWRKKAHELHHHHATLIADILRELPDDDPRTLTDAKNYRASNGGDNQKLRGIPAIGPGVAGHIPGTNPGDIR